MKLCIALLFLSPILAQQVALTVDDLPVHGPLPHGMTRAGIARSVAWALINANAPRVYGFVNGDKLRTEPEGMDVLKVWTASTFPLGNHTFTHMNLDNNTAEAFEKDIEANEPLLWKLSLPGAWFWFRYPYLHEGDTLEKRHQVRAFLQKKQYRIAEVTLDFDDYAWNAPYARCLDKGNSQAIEGLKASYLKNASEGIRVGQEMSKTLFGRDIKHVMLLHIGCFETVMLPKLLDLLKQRGFRLITLDDAESDPAYRTDPDLAFRGGGTLLELMMSARHLKYPAREKSPPPALESVCK
jgi:peptidoglycan/xylan/chitin deacetylase (PgdA/CDA1 family)